MFFCCLLFFFQNHLFWKIHSGIPKECQTIWTQIRPNVLLGLIWVQTVWKGYQQTTIGGKELRNRFYSGIWPEVIIFSCSTQLSMKFQPLIKTKILTNEEASCKKSLRCCIYHANKRQMPLIVGILKKLKYWQMKKLLDKSLGCCIYHANKC